VHPCAEVLPAGSTLEGTAGSVDRGHLPSKSPSDCRTRPWVVSETGKIRRVIPFSHQPPPTTTLVSDKDLSGVGGATTIAVNPLRVQPQFELDRRNGRPCVQQAVGKPHRRWRTTNQAVTHSAVGSCIEAGLGSTFLATGIFCKGRQRSVTRRPCAAYRLSTPGKRPLARCRGFHDPWRYGGGASQWSASLQDSSCGAH
jgi:hypothetical protein